jgi:23S rRNA pseudouridine1911/1915/1917 synthase
VVEPTENEIRSYLRESKAFVMHTAHDEEEGQLAITHYQTIKSNKKYTMLKVNLETGRKNQIRVHLQSIGHPVIGDKKYGATEYPIERLGLHAWVLGFTHPITKEHMRFETNVPRKFASLF